MVALGRIGLAAGVMLLLFGASYGMASEDALAKCRSASNADARLKACSELIEWSSATAEQKGLGYRNRGRTRAEAGATDAALADLTEAIKLNPADGQAYGYRAQVHVTRRNLDAAISDFGDVIRLRPKAVFGYSGRGHAYLVKGDARQAIDDFSQALRLAPGSAVAYNNRGLAYKAQGNLPRAIEDFTLALSINPLYGLAYNNRAYTHEAAGRKAEAVADFRSALLVDPALTGAREGLARLGAAGELAAESERLISAGKALVEMHCARCHAISAEGASPNTNAPPFRSLHKLHPVQALREPLTRGIAAPHDEMPKFKLPDADVDKIVAYINSLEVRE